MFVHKIVLTAIYTAEDFYTYYDPCNPIILPRLAVYKSKFLPSNSLT